MSLKTHIEVLLPLPDGGTGGAFTIEPLDLPLDVLRLTDEGVIERELYRFEDVPESERDHKKGELAWLIGSSRRIHEGWEIEPYTGFAYLISSTDDRVYTGWFKEGRAIEIRKGGIGAWADGITDPWQALEFVKDVLESGCGSVLPFVNGVLAKRR